MSDNKIVKRSSSSSSSSSKNNIKKVFSNKLPVTTVVDKDDDDDDIKSSNTSRGLLESYLDSMAILGHDKTALLASFGLFLLSLVLSMYMNGNVHHSFKTVIPSWLSSSSQQSSSSTSSLTAEQERLYQQLGPIPHMDAPYIYHVDDLQDSHNMTVLRQTYQRDGVVAIRGLIDASLLQRLDTASAKHIQEEWDKQMLKKSNTAGHGPRKTTRQGTQFFTNLNHLALTDPPFPSSSSSNNNSCSADDESSQSSGDDESNEMKTITMNPFLQTALMSQIPNMAATLLGLTDSSDTNGSSCSGDNQNDNNNLRLIRDIFLAKDDDPYICGWHVDDYGFWPVTPTSPPGINAWIALDDYDVDVNGGGFAIAIASHTATWRNEAHYVTGASTTAPTEGYTCAKDLFDRRTGFGTCNLKTSAPHLHHRMEETKRIYPKLYKGDVILHDRWLFHRTVPLLKTFIEQQQQQDQDQDDVNDGGSQPPPILRRYSIRYGPGSSVIPPGYGTELSVLWDDANGGKTANQICSSIDINDNTTIVYPWYPQAWPHVLLERELSNLQSLVQHQFPMALKRQERHLKEMKPHRKRLARQQNHPTLAGNKK